MTATSQVHSGIGAESGQHDGLRLIVLVLIFALSWIGVDPFSDLGSDAWVSADPPVSLANILAYVSVGGLAVWVTYRCRSDALRLLAGPMLWVVIGWLTVTSITSQNPSLSFRRLVLTIIVMAMAAAGVVLPKTLRQFAGVLGALSLGVLIASFIGVFFAPHFSVHQATDAIEPQLAGDWRGIFEHKNVAAMMMVHFVFIGVLVFRVIDKVLGGSIVALALVFLVGTGGKTSFGLLLLALALAPLFNAVRQRWVKAALAFIPVVLLSVATVGSVLLPGVSQFNHVLLRDATFTGRSDIWLFALEKLRERPITGYGFQAFWGTASTMYGNESLPQQNSESQLDESATRADHAHNTYLDIALTTGLPGLVISTIWLVVLPIGAFARAQAARAPRELMLFFAQNWLFSIHFGCLESLFFFRTYPAWLLMLVGIFGIRLLGRLPVRP